MHIGGGQAAVPVDRLAIPTIAGFGQNQRGKRGVALRIMEGMPGQPAFRQVDELRAEGGQALLHDRAAGQQAADAAARLLADTTRQLAGLELQHHGARQSLEDCRARLAELEQQLADQLKPLDEALAEPGWRDAMVTVWEDGQLLVDQTLAEVRARSAL